MSNVTTEIIGIDALRAKLGKLSAAVTGNALRLAVLSGANPIVNEAKRLAPYRTGNLRRSIDKEVTLAEDTACEVKIGTNVEYAARMEYGFKGAEKVGMYQRMQTMAWGKPITPRRVNVGMFTRQANTAPHPYMRPAFDSRRQAAVTEISDAFAILIRKAVE